jgi:uncharacterized protein
MLQEILLKQKREYERKIGERYHTREVKVKGLDTDLISVVIGPRRAGKSFLCMHALKETNAGAYINFDDETLTGEVNFNDILNTLSFLYENPKTLLLDEIQNVPRWELIVNRLHREGYKLILTGSNSKLLSRELSTHLTGRNLQTSVLPFSCREILTFFGPSFTPGEKQTLAMKYITNGGFPEPWVKGYDFNDYLGSLFDALLFRDIVQRYKIRDTVLLYAISKYLVTNLAGEYSMRSLVKAVNANSDRTVGKYLGYLEEVFLFFRVPRFSFKVKEQIKSSQKIYCFDTGFYQARAFAFSPNTGQLFENAVAIELWRRQTTGKETIYYWKNDQKEEVDFVIHSGIKTEHLIQVCADIREPKVLSREIRSLLKAGAELQCNHLTIITLETEKTETHSWFGVKGEIEFIPFWKWASVSI